MQLKSDSVLFENFTEIQNDDCRNARLHYLIDKSEFLRYDLVQETILVFSWLDFFHAIEFAQQLNYDIKIQFQKCGKPIILTIETGSTYSIQIIETTMSNQAIEKKRQKKKVIAYKENASNYFDAQNIDLQGSELNRALSPGIQVTKESEKVAALAEKDMDVMIEASERAKRIKTNNPNLSAVEQQEMENVLRDLSNCEEMMDIDDEPLDFNFNHEVNSCKQQPEPSLSMYRLQASRERIELERKRAIEKPKKLKKIFSKVEKNTTLKVICHGSDSEDSIIDSQHK